MTKFDSYEAAQFVFKQLNAKGEPWAMGYALKLGKELGVISASHLTNDPDKWDDQLDVLEAIVRAVSIQNWSLNYNKPKNGNFVHNGVVISDRVAQKISDFTAEEITFIMSTSPQDVLFLIALIRQLKTAVALLSDLNDKYAEAAENARKTAQTPAVAPQEPVSGETITISRAEYESLKEDSNFLNALYAAGVDNWDGYDEALENNG
jgi:hypothetical protein